MSIIKLDGKALANEILETQHLVLDENLRRPKVVVITIGNDDASVIYLRNKKRACEKCDIRFEHISFTEDTDYGFLKNYIETMNDTNTIDGIMIQQPVPERFEGLEQYIKNSKDVDGFTTYNLGGTLNNEKHISACTPSGILQLLHYYNIELSGKHVVILGRSNIVGKPLIGMLLNENATVTSCNSYTKNLQGITLNADILISAMGQPKYINSHYITTRCTCIIDVGINRDENNKVCGDVNYKDIIDMWSSWEKTGDKVERYITPVPGGVGPMTVASFVKNINLAYSRNVINYKGEDFRDENS